MIFEDVNIDKKLEINTEKAAIDALQIDDTNTVDLFKIALKTEKIKGTNKTFLEMATEFNQYVTYEAAISNGVEEIDAKFTIGAGAPTYLEKFVSIDDNNDFAYLLYKISEVLKVDITTGLTSLKLGVETTTQLTALKAEIEKPAVVEVPTDAIKLKVGAYTVGTTGFTLGVLPTGDTITRTVSLGVIPLTPALAFDANGGLTTPTVTNEIATPKITYAVALKDGVITLTESKIIVPTEALTIVETDIGTEFTKYGVKTSEIVAAIATLQKNLIANKATTLPDGTTTIATAITYLKDNKVIELQKALGMEETATTFDKRADGLFGQRSLKNLEAGKVITYTASEKINGNNKNNLSSSVPVTQEVIISDPKNYHLVGPDYEGNYYPLPGYEFKSNDNKDGDLTVIEDIKPTYEETIKNPTKYNLTYDEITGELKPIKNYTWLNKTEDDFRAIPNQYDLKTKSINDLIDIAFDRKKPTEAEYKTLNQYDLMVIYSAKPEFKFGKEVAQDDKITEEINTEIPSTFIGSTPDKLDIFVDTKTDTWVISNGVKSHATERKIRQYDTYKIGDQAVGVVIDNLMDKYPYNNTETLWSEIIQKNDPIINAYILYKAMEGAGTKEEWIQKLVANPSIDWTKTYQTFGTIDGENLITRLFNDLDTKSNSRDAKMLDVIITELVAGKDANIQKDITTYLNSNEWHTYALPKTYALFEAKINNKGLIA